MKTSKFEQVTSILVGERPKQIMGNFVVDGKTIRVFESRSAYKTMAGEDCIYRKYDNSVRLITKNHLKVY